MTAAQAYNPDLHRFLPLPGVFTYYDTSFTYVVGHLILTIQDLPVDTDPEERFICPEKIMILAIRLSVPPDLRPF